MGRRPHGGAHDGYSDTERWTGHATTPAQPAPFAALPAAVQDAIWADPRAILAGALGGLMGTGTMSAVMLATHQTGRMGRLPPERITQRLFFRGRRRRHETAKNRLAVLFHFGFGGAGGAAFGWLNRRVSAAIPPILSGPLFGCLMWPLSYQGWVPALGLLPPAHRDRSDRRINMALAHVIYGATLGSVVGALERRSRK